MARKAGRIMTRKAPEIIEVTSQQFDDILERAASNTLRDEDTELMRSIFESYAGFFQIVGNKNTTIARLRKMMFGATSETSKNVLGDAEDASNREEPATRRQCGLTGRGLASGKARKSPETPRNS